MPKRCSKKNGKHKAHLHRIVDSSEKLVLALEKQSSDRVISIGARRAFQEESIRSLSSWVRTSNKAQTGEGIDDGIIEAKAKETNIPEEKEKIRKSIENKKTLVSEPQEFDSFSIGNFKKENLRSVRSKVVVKGIYKRVCEHFLSVHPPQHGPSKDPLSEKEHLQQKFPVPLTVVTQQFRRETKRVIRRKRECIRRRNGRTFNFNKSIKTVYRWGGSLGFCPVRGYNLFDLRFEPSLIRYNRAYPVAEKETRRTEDNSSFPKTQTNTSWPWYHVTLPNRGENRTAGVGHLEKSSRRVFRPKIILEEVAKRYSKSKNGAPKALISRSEVLEDLPFVWDETKKELVKNPAYDGDSTRESKLNEQEKFDILQTNNHILNPYTPLRDKDQTERRWKSLSKEESNRIEKLVATRVYTGIVKATRDKNRRKNKTF